MSLGYLGSVFGVVMVVPQIARILRHPTLTGVSASSWAMTTVACLAWLSYGIRTASMPQIPGNLLLVTGAVAVVLLVPAEWSRGRRGAALAAAAGGVLAVSWLVPPHVTGYVAFSIGLCASWPQLYDSIGNWRARITSGVAVSTWALRIGSQVCWLAFGVLSRDVPVLISACVVLTSALCLVALEVAARSPEIAAVAASCEQA